MIHANCMFIPSRRQHPSVQRDWIFDICSFFFQAEDGIRDVAVTGVQTCALPIFASDKAVLICHKCGMCRLPLGPSALFSNCNMKELIRRVVEHIPGYRWLDRYLCYKIGRASCRERV